MTLIGRLMNLALDAWEARQRRLAWQRAQVGIDLAAQAQREAQYQAQVAELDQQAGKTRRYRRGLERGP